MNIKKSIEIFAGKINAPEGLSVWILSCMGIMSLRTFTKAFLASDLSGQEIVLDFLHEFLFFTITCILIWLAYSFFLRENPKKFKSIFFWSFWIIIFPPLIDMLKTGGDIYWSFYLLGKAGDLWKEYISFFGHLPSGIYYFGTRIMCAVGIIFSAGIIYLGSKSVIRTVLAGWVIYCLLFFMAAFPTFFAWGYFFLSGTKKISEVGPGNIMQFLGGSIPIFGLEAGSFSYALAYNLSLVFYLFFLLLLLVLFFLIDRKKLWAVIKNARFPQLIYHSGLFFVGIGLGCLAYPDDFHLNVFSVTALLNLLASVWLAWLASVSVNDVYDFKVDNISNPERPLQQKILSKNEYLDLGAVFFFLSLFGALVVGWKFMLLLAIYQFLAWTYSAEPFRFKRFPFVATFISASASILIIFAGYLLLSYSHGLSGLSWRIILLLLIAYTLCLPIKDFKDIEGDKKDQIWTIPVLFGDKTGRKIVSTGVFVSFILSVFFLNELRLFWWALLFGIISYLVISSQKIHPRKLFYWVLALISVYVCILVRICF